MGLRERSSRSKVDGDSKAIERRSLGLPSRAPRLGCVFPHTRFALERPRYGPNWEEEFLDSGPVYARIDPDRMFTFAMPSADVTPESS